MFIQALLFCGFVVPFSHASPELAVASPAPLGVEWTKGCNNYSEASGQAHSGV